MKFGSLRNLPKKTGQEGAVKLLPSGESKGLGMSDGDGGEEDSELPLLPVGLDEEVAVSEADFAVEDAIEEDG